MSRSYRKTPIYGITSARSEAADKRIWHRRWRRTERMRLVVLTDPDEYITTPRNEVSIQWMSKDGKYWRSCAALRRWAGWWADCHAQELAHRETLFIRAMAKLRAK